MEGQNHPEWEENTLRIMTPGPTQVASNVYQARAYATTNPDLDVAFFDFYRDTCELVGELIGTRQSVYIMSGEGILGLEAACASLTEPGDRVLVLDNGIFGKGFSDFVSMYEGEPVLYSSDYHRPIDVDALETFLERDHDFKYATVVHSDTPSGVLNPVERICPLLKRYGILTVVDTVTGMFAETLQVDEWQIDIACGGSQKALSAPPGLTMVSVSDAAKKIMAARRVPIRAFYANLQVFEGYYEKKWFPYTMPISDIYGLRAALENVKADENHLTRHKILAKAVRKTLQQAGFHLYLQDGFASSVTAFDVPEGMTDRQILQKMQEEHHIMIAGCFDVLAGKVLRIGHMGNNANTSDLADTLDALQQVVSSLGMDVKLSSMREEFSLRCRSQMAERGE
ncbi:MAG: alanine--glyoxylate aminotransferase family protein [Lachnospiraceae bacterium]|nr:alanine--glyoxylate aminotransferase family protein [Lachnospiraceae bacterium]